MPADEYERKLQTDEWLNRRQQILERDCFRCQVCGVQRPVKRGLQVHHRYYVANKMPWDYPDDALTTRCFGCHQAEHESGHVPVYQEIDGILVRCKPAKCQRCRGDGWFQQYRHIDNGLCFRCRGNRVDPVLIERIESDPEKAATARILPELGDDHEAINF